MHIEVWYLSWHSNNAILLTFFFPPLLGFVWHSVPNLQVPVLCVFAQRIKRMYSILSQAKLVQIRHGNWSDGAFCIRESQVHVALKTAIQCIAYRGRLRGMPYFNVHVLLNFLLMPVWYVKQCFFDILRGTITWISGLQVVLVID